DINRVALPARRAWRLHPLFTVFFVILVWETPVVGGANVKRSLWISGMGMAVLCGASAWAGVGVWSGQGPYGGYVYDLLQSPASTATLYISTRSGIFKSTDSGASW